MKKLLGSIFPPRAKSRETGPREIQPEVDDWMNNILDIALTHRLPEVWIRRDRGQGTLTAAFQRYVRERAIQFYPGIEPERQQTEHRVEPLAVRHEQFTAWMTAVSQTRVEGERLKFPVTRMTFTIQHRVGRVVAVAYVYHPGGLGVADLIFDYNA